MNSPQPDWIFIAQLGDAHPIDHGGYFIYVDRNGIYEPEAEKLDGPHEDPDDLEQKDWTIHRFTIEDMWHTNGILSDNQFHKDKPAWFASPYDPARPQDGPGGLEELAGAISSTVGEVRDAFLSPSLLVRATAWQLVGDVHGFYELDQYHLHMTKGEVTQRYEKEIATELDRTRRGEFKTYRKAWAHHPRGGRIYGFASEPYPGLDERTERKIAPSIEAAARGHGMSFPEEHVEIVQPGDQWINPNI